MQLPITATHPHAKTTELAVTPKLTYFMTLHM